MTDEERKLAGNFVLAEMAKILKSTSKRLGRSFSPKSNKESYVSTYKITRKR